MGTIWTMAVWIARGACCFLVVCMLALAGLLLWGNGVRTLGERTERRWRL